MNKTKVMGSMHGVAKKFREHQFAVAVSMSPETRNLSSNIEIIMYVVFRKAI
jgi:hypothetical protein